MGVVYKARQPGLDRLVAVKILPPESGRDPTFAERFTREARALARLNHPNIVSVYDFGRASEFYYFIMELVDGLNLRQLEQSRRLTPQEALSIVPRICEALQYAHDEGIVHRDIKPGNILVDKRGRVKIADFGLAKLLGKESKDLTLTGSRQVMGTPHYMAPEQMEKPQTVDHRADIYSLGVVFYEMLTGELPVGSFSLPSEKVQVDVRVDEVVLKSLRREPERRYQHASEVKTDVETISSPLKPAPMKPASEPPANLRFEITSGVWGWFGEVLGVLRLEKDALLIEFEVKSILPFVRRSPKEVRVPYADIASVELDKETLMSELTIRTAKMAGLAVVPTSQQGQVVFDAADFEAQGDAYEPAKRFVAHLRNRVFGEPLPEPPPISRETQRTSLRFSRKAIVGAAWVPTVIAVTIPILAANDMNQFTQSLGPINGPDWWRWLLAFTFLTLPVSAPFVTTILGLSAIRDIRHSQGRLTGLPLAVTDALLFSLLAFDALLCFLLALLLVSLGYLDLATTALTQSAPFLLLAILTCAGADIFITRWAWRAAKKPVGGGGEPPPTVSSPPVHSVPSSESETRVSITPSTDLQPSWSVSPPEPAASPSVLRSAWEDWWSQRSEFLTKTVKAILTLVYFACLMMFFSYRGSGSMKAFRHEVGFPTHWFLVEKHDGGHSFGANIFSSAWLVIALGILAFYVHNQITKNQRALTWKDTTLHYMAWLLLAAIAIGVSISPLILELFLTKSHA